jgi:hypothetical protein
MTAYTDEYLKYLYTEDLYIMQKDAGIPVQVSPVVEEDTHETSLPDKANGPVIVKYIGSNKKGILILVHDKENEFLNRKDMDFLMRIIEGGLKISKTDIAVVNCNRFTYEQIFDEINHQYVIAFGNHSASFTGNNPKYQIYPNQGKIVLLADELKDIEPSRDKKTVLWKALQLMFDIK